LIDDLTAAVREEQLERDAWIWVDRIRNRTQPPVNLEEILEEEGLRGDLVRLAANRSSDPETAKNLVEEVLAPAIAQLAARPELAVVPEEVIESARDLCLDWLAGDGEG
jgi:hypothetical protein